MYIPNTFFIVLYFIPLRSKLIDNATPITPKIDFNISSNRAYIDYLYSKQKALSLFSGWIFYFYIEY